MYLSDPDQVCKFTITWFLYLCSIDNRLEELQEKYSQEVEERKRLEAELKVLQVKVGTILIFIMCDGLFLVVDDVN